MMLSAPCISTTCVQNSGFLGWFGNARKFALQTWCSNEVHFNPCTTNSSNTTKMSRTELLPNVPRFEAIDMWTTVGHLTRNFH